MRNSTAVESTRLLSPWALLVVTALIGTLLVLTYNGDDVFMPSEKQPDAVSINYAELLLEAHPDDTSLRLKLIEQLIGLGDLVRARSHVFKLDGPESGNVRFFLAELAVLEAQADVAGISSQTRDALRDQLRTIERDEISIEQLVRYAQHALALSDAALAARAYADLAIRDVERSEAWLNEAARAHLGAGETSAAAEIYTQLLASADGAGKRQAYLGNAFSALLAADQSEQAAAVIHRNLDLLTGTDGALLSAAVQAGIGSHRYDLAADTVTRWRSLLPEDGAALSSDFRLRLAAGQLEQAWTVGKRLAELDSQSPETLEAMGKLAEWTGRTSEALGYWLMLVQLRDEPSVREHAWRLAAQLFDFDSTIHLLAGAGEHRRLTDSELDALVYSHSQRGTPEQAERWLRGYLKIHPGHQLAWSRLQQILEQTQQLDAQVQLWADLDRRSGLTIAQRVSWAHANWEQFDPQAAWQVLDSASADSVTDEAYWLLRADLAWELERDADALESYVKLQALGVDLDKNGEERLLALYERGDPARALELLVASWERNRTPANLTRALQFAMQVGDLSRLRTLVEDGQQLPGSEDVMSLWSARALLAQQADDSAAAEQIYLEALTRFPHAGEFREGLLWHYVDNGDKAALLPLLQKWQGLAGKHRGMWLPYASANLVLNRNDQALRWFALYLRGSPDDQLVQAAYADALDSAGYTDRALRLRRHLLRTLEVPSSGAEVAEYQTYVRLLSASGETTDAALKALWRDGSRPMLQLWFDQFSERLDALNQDVLKGTWLAWARHKGLRISRYAELQQALLQHNRQTLEQLLAKGGLDAAQRVEILQRLGADSQAMAESLAALSPEQPVIVQQQLRRQALALQERKPQGLQLGLRQEDFGTLELKGQTALIARQLDPDWHAQLSLARQRYSGEGLFTARPGIEQAAELQLRRILHDGWLDVTTDASRNDEGNRLGVGLSRGLQLNSAESLEFQLDWHRRAQESGLLRAMGRRDGLAVNGFHAFSARDQVSWSLAHQRFSTLDGEDLAHGQQLSLELSHAVFFEGPTWTLRSGLSYANYDLVDELRSDSPTPADFLQERFGQLYVGSTWRRGFPGSLNRVTPQYSWLVDVQTGWQWTESEIGYAINTGVGMQVLGDDELAFTFGYQSAPRNGEGESGGTLGMTYSARFGR